MIYKTILGFSVPLGVGELTLQWSWAYVGKQNSWGSAPALVWFNLRVSWCFASFHLFSLSQAGQEATHSLSVLWAGSCRGCSCSAWEPKTLCASCPISSLPSTPLLWNVSKQVSLLLRELCIGTKEPAVTSRFKTSPPPSPASLGEAGIYGRAWRGCAHQAGRARGCLL